MKQRGAEVTYRFRKDKEKKYPGSTLAVGTIFFLISLFHAL